MSQDELTDFTAAGNHYDRVVEEQMIESKKRRETSLQYLRSIDEKLSSEMAEIKVKIDQVCSDAEENGQLSLNAFQSRSAENESEKLNKTSRDEMIYGDEFHKFEAEKEKFMAWLEESRNMGKDKLGTIDDHIKQVNYCIKRRKKVYDDARALVKLDAADSVDEMRVDPTTTTSTS
ncbi:uncharacterized protein LOC115662547 isoform X2 [Syzygium oleosum]|uniref:uncharacterized protein LOC115662547 isoform X2 n=1 Tax=Syzygium oleosum TaxID=219896 RepID=UPI0024B8F6A7|nr:uncharacterized protein LOC115662547 isoform X2 [Syzygium oleosum]